MALVLWFLEERLSTCSFTNLRGFAVTGKPVIRSVMFQEQLHYCIHPNLRPVLALAVSCGTFICKKNVTFLCLYPKIVCLVFIVKCHI